MKRNLLIGTSLVAAFASTSLDARSFSVMTEEARADNTALAAAAHIVTVGHATATGKKALKAGESDAFATIYNSVAAQLLAERTEAAKDGKVAPVTLADVTAALARNPAVLKIVKGQRDAVIAQVAKNSVAAPAVAPVDQVVGPVAPVGPTTEEVTVATLTKAISEAKEAATKAIRDEADANAELEGAVATVTTATTDLEAADTALTAANTSAAEAATKASEAKATLTAAEEDLKTSNAKKKELEATVEKVTSDAEGKAEGSREVLDLAKLKADIEALNADIAIKAFAQDTAATKLAEANTAKTEAETAATDAKTAHETAVKTLADATAAKTEAETAATAAKTAQAEAVTKLEAAKKVALEAAQAAATTAANEATAAENASNAAELKKTELATADQQAAQKVKDLTEQQKSLIRELAAARNADGAESTTDTQAAVKAKENAAEGIATEIQKAKNSAYHAAQDAKKAVNAAAKADADAVKANEAKVTADNELKDAQDLAKSSDEVITALKAEILAALNAEQAAAKNAEADAEASDAAKANSEAEQAAKAAQEEAANALTAAENAASILTAAQNALEANPHDLALQNAVAAAKAAKDEAEAAAKAAQDAAVAKDALVAAAKAAKDKAEAAAKAAKDEAKSAEAERDQARIASSAAVEEARGLAAQLEAETAARKAADKKASDLTAQLDAVNFDKVLESTIEELEAQLEVADVITRAALQANLGTVTKLEKLTKNKVTGTDNKPSDAIARQINAKIDWEKVVFLSERGAKGLTDEFVTGLDLSDLIAEIQTFDAVQDLIDADVTEESKETSSDDRVRKELVRNLQAMFQVKLDDVIKTRQVARAGTALIEAQKVAEIASLKRLDAALSTVERNQTDEAFELMKEIQDPAHFGGKSAWISRGGERSYAREEVKVQNLTAETIAELHGALKDYLAYLNSVIGDSEIDMLSVASKSKFQGILASCGLENVSITEALSKLESRSNPSADDTILMELSDLLTEANKTRSAKLSDDYENHDLAVAEINNAVDAILTAPKAPTKDSSEAGDEEGSSAPRGDDAESVGGSSNTTPRGDDAAEKGQSAGGKFGAQPPVDGGSHPSSVRFSEDPLAAGGNSADGHRMTEAELRKAETERVAKAKLVSGKAAHSEDAAASDDDSEALVEREPAASLAVRQPGESDDQLMERLGVEVAAQVIGAESDAGANAIQQRIAARAAARQAAAASTK